ncbi:CMRF35-like molecule 5 [Dissostichus eleginoides]|uniref:CMRF35-like molecule 5 n=1 Tax=Dissostichus eleginoides TaxID=100907 RepID=A0AAD9C7I7_DISEL|nr:CMRF35-like molecule 5 [Dissostichus eleginoides]
MFPLFPLVALSFVEMKPLNTRGCKSMHRRQTHHHQSSTRKTTQQNRMEILNRGNDLFVTFTNLIKSDANTYYCGVERNGPDPWIKVNLKVTDAASYCPKRTPDTFMSKKMMKQRKVVSTAVMPQEDAREEAEYDEIRHEEATDPDSLYANNSFLQDIGSAAAGCETNSRGACAESRDNVLYSVAQLPKDQIKPTGQSQLNQSESAENDSFYDLVQLPQAP